MMSGVVEKPLRRVRRAASADDAAPDADAPPPPQTEEPAYTADQKRDASRAWNDARKSGLVKLPNEDVVAAIRAKIFNPSKKEKPLKLVWSDER